MRHKITASIIFLIFFTRLSATPVELKNNFCTVDFLEHAQMLADTANLYNSLPPTDIANLQFKDFDKSQISDHIKTYWFKFQIDNKLATYARLYLSFGYSNEDITIYKIVNNEVKLIKNAGTDHSYSSKDVKIGREEILSLEIAGNEVSDILVKINNKRGYARQYFSYSLSSFKIYSEPGFIRNFIDIKVINSFFYGAILIMFVYNLILASTLKSRSYAFYSLFIFLYFLYNATSDGLSTEVFLGNHTYFDRILRIIIAPAMIISYILFARNYLETGKYLPKIDKLLLIGILILVLDYIFLIRGYWWLGRDILFVTISLAVTFVSLASVLSIKRNRTPGLYFTSANALLLISGLIYIFYLSDIIPHNGTTKPIEYLIQISSLVQLAIFSLGLSHRLKMAETELIAQRILNETEKKELIEQKNIELEHKVNERTMELSLQKHEMTAINEQLEQKVRERTKKLQKAYRDLLNLNYELDSFIYRAAHDIRGPITTIMGLCNLALLEKDFNKCQEYILILDKYSKTTQITLNRILGVNDLKNNHIKLSHFSIEDLKKGVMALMINNQDYTKVNISFALPEEDDLYSDMYLIQLILQNMIDNSIRFRSTKSDTKPFCKVIIEKDEAALKISIIDNGEGIDETIKDKIFDMFFRGSEYSSGSGLGLYIVKIAVKKLNGTIDLTSRKNDTVFEMTFPYIKDKSVRTLSQMALQTPVN